MKKHCIKVLFSKVNFNELHRITYQFLWNFTKRIVDFFLAIVLKKMPNISLLHSIAKFHPQLDPMT